MRHDRQNCIEKNPGRSIGLQRPTGTYLQQRIKTKRRKDALSPGTIEKHIQRWLTFGTASLVLGRAAGALSGAVPSLGIMETTTY